MKQNNKNCIICGKSYTFCTNCSKFDHLPRWMGMFHSKECKDIFDTISDYQSKVCTKEAAKNRLIDAGILNMTLRSPVQKIADEIMSDSDKNETAKNNEIMDTLKVSDENTDSSDADISNIKTNVVHSKKKKAILKK